jgi:hypothetical protein
MEVEEAVARALALHKSPPSADDAATIREVIPVLALALDPKSSEHVQELHALVDRWLADPSDLGRRARDLAVELAHHVARDQKNDRIAQRLLDMLEELAGHFNGDWAAAAAWMRHPNRELGNLSPLELVEGGRGELVQDLIDAFGAAQPN